MFCNLKPPTTFDEQIDILISRGLTINNKKKARDVLSTLNYYTLTGYLHDFKKDDDTYFKGLTFEKVYSIIEFDRRFRNILMYGIETVEKILKTKISYNFVHYSGAMGYLDQIYFKDKKEHSNFLKKLDINIYNNRNLPFIKHHNNKYKGGLPLWVAVEIFTMGMLSHFYRNIPTTNQKQIAREFNTGPRQLLSWMENMTYLRNLVAHYMRLYNFKLQKTPVKCKNNHKYYNISNKVFDIIHIMKFLILDEDEWDIYILEGLDSLITQYDTYIELESIGFPINWKDILIKKQAY